MTLSFFERFGLAIILLLVVGGSGLLVYEKVRDNRLRHGLMTAIQDGDAEGLRKLLAQGADANMAATDLIDKPSAGRLLQCTLPNELQKQKPDPRTTMLMLAVLSKHAYLISLLLNAGADINARDEYGFTALGLAISEGRLDMVQQLLEHGADPNLPNDSQMPLLNWAIMVREGTIARALLDKKADPNTPDGNGMPPLYLACVDDDAPTVRALLEHGAKPNVVYRGWSLLRLSVEQDNADITRALLHKGAAQNETLPDGRTLLQFAIDSKKSRVIPILKQALPHVQTASTRPAPKHSLAGSKAHKLHEVRSK